MNVCENEAVIAFDTLYTQNHIQILKILLPYFDPYGQNHLAVWIKYLELRYTLEYVSRHPSPPYKNQTSGASTTVSVVVMLAISFSSVLTVDSLMVSSGRLFSVQTSSDFTR